LALEHYRKFFYPLDGIANWNRLFGRRGFYQYQCVVPQAAAEAIGEMVTAAARAKEGSFLSVLKVFGDLPGAGWLSFPRPGITLALDFPDRGRSTLDLLNRLDAIAVEAGGAVYPAKDARMAPAVFQRSFPNWERLETYRDPAINSDFWQRVAV
jgi:FAD/FMN-containing dehydrogenase